MDTRSATDSPVTPSSRSSKPSSSSRSSMNRPKQPLSAFIVEQFKSYSKSEACLAKEWIQPRIVITHFINLWRHWQTIPIDVLYQSIMILPCKRSWLYDLTNCDVSESKKHSKYCNKLLSFLESVTEKSYFRAFQAMILQKEKQGLLLWLDPLVNNSNNGGKSDEKSDKPFAKIDRQWETISHFISSIADPVRHCNYYPLQLDQHWWHSKFEHCHNLFEETCEDLFTQLEHCTNHKKISNELKSLQFRHKSMLEILHQSNPTMVPMLKWCKVRWNLKSNQIVQYQKSLIAMGELRNWDPIDRCSQALQLDNDGIDDDELIVLSADHELVSTVDIKSLRISK